MTLREAKKVLGVKFSGKDQNGINLGLAAWRKQHAQARRDGDDELEKILSQAKEALKNQQFGKCVVCGGTITERATYCRAHQLPARKALPSTQAESGQKFKAM